MWGFFQVIAGGALALLGSYFANRQNGAVSNSQWVATATARHNRQTAKRLHRLYIPLAKATGMIQAVATERKSGVTWNSDGTTENRDKRHVSELNEANSLVVAIGDELNLENEAKPIRDLYFKFRE
jgi:hypothetical protein